MLGVDDLPTWFRTQAEKTFHEPFTLMSRVAFLWISPTTKAR
jgi:hypothetical protein